MLLLVLFMLLHLLLFVIFAADINSRCMILIRTGGALLQTRHNGRKDFDRLIPSDNTQCSRHPGNTRTLHLLPPS